MVRFLLCLAVLVAAPWLMVSGALLAACGWLACSQPGQAAAGIAVVGAATLVGIAAFEVLAASPAPSVVARQTTGRD